MSFAHVEENPTTPASVSSESGAALYDEAYYHHQCGPEPYTRSAVFLEMFGQMADNLIRTYAPAEVIDVGCAHGFLVESLWDRGVRATGIDISPYAISQVRRDMAPHCSVGSVLEPIDGRYDLACCIEVLEHIAESDVPAAIANICAAADRIVFSSTPSDLDEPTHCYVQPPLVWIDLFADAGFVVDLDADLAFVSPHAIGFKRSTEPQSSELRTFCSRLIRYRMLAHERGMLYFGLAADADRTSAAERAARERAEAELASRDAEAAVERAAAAQLRADNSELAAANRALTDELAYRRRKIEELSAEMDELRRANVAYEVAVTGTAMRVRSDARRTLDEAHELDARINALVAGGFWSLKKLLAKRRA